MHKSYIKTKWKMPKVTEEPTMSDTTLLVTVEELINRAMGPPDANVVDFKLVQLILEILARQQRMLQQKIEIEVTELIDEQVKRKRATGTSESSSSKTPPRTKSFMAIKHEHKSPQKRKRKDLEQKSFKEEASSKNVNIIVKVQSHKEETSKEEMDRKDQKRTEKETQKEEIRLEKEDVTKIIDQETDKNVQREKGGLGEEEIKEQKKDDKKSQEEQEILEKEKDSLAKEEILKEKVEEKTYEIDQRSEREMRVKRNQEEENDSKTEAMGESLETEQIKLRQQAESEESRDEKYQEKGHIPAYAKEGAYEIDKKLEREMRVKREQDKQKDSNTEVMGESLETEQIKLRQQAESEETRDEKYQKKEHIPAYVKEKSYKIDQRLEREMRVKREQEEQKDSNAEVMGESLEIEQIKLEQQAEPEQKRDEKYQEKEHIPAYAKEKSYKIDQRLEREMTVKREQEEEKDSKTEVMGESLEIEQIKLKQQAEPEQKRDEKYQEKEHTPAHAKKRVVPIPTSNGSRINITEKQIDNEKILVNSSARDYRYGYKSRIFPSRAPKNPRQTRRKRNKQHLMMLEKRPSTRSETPSPSGIDFVTSSRFALLEEAVQELRSMAAPKPLLLPGKENLISDIIKGTVSLPEAMQALQVEEKMKSAEESVANIMGLLTQLASAGALPQEIAEEVETLIPPSYYEEAYQSQPMAGKKSTAIESKLSATQSQISRAPDSRPSDTPEPSVTPSVMPGHSTVSKSSTVSSMLKVPCVMYKDMRDNLKDLKDEFTKILNRMVDNVTQMTETAQHITKTVADRLDVVQKLDSRISALHSRLVDCANLFSGFDSVLKTQLQSIEDQLAQTREIVVSGLARLVEVNSNTEATAIMAMLQRCEEMDTELSRILHELKLMMAKQTEFSVQTQILLDCIKMMREEKADRDEVLDGLKAKADASQLAGRLAYLDFEAAHADFNRRIYQCHERFNRNVVLWTEFTRDMKIKRDKKANFIELLLERDAVEQQLRVLNKKIRILSAVLGDPQIAVTTRQLAVGAVCASCHESALMEAVDATSGAPPRLPPVRHAAASRELRNPEWIRAGPLEHRHHYCRRWCGGSHTLASDPARHIQLHVQMHAIPTRKYTDYGEDERLYMFEEELRPCIECNALGGEKTQDLPESASLPELPGDISVSHAEPKPSAKCTCPTK